ncbi:DNA adenine methylase [Parabacteroides merdae]|jgi:hypothetical protein|uniref:DNA methyltransferase n=1 Tax=Parabacteroides merdae TaxID=46503 RepID=A0A7K1HBC0_9BACT|nr:DNA adenine methylase [Parabacteroides merdae]MTU28519.1 DNA methyltransferase [Parabacteroides merdae]RYS85059.1 DNA methyltransferase [Parabacteroides merdae]
MKLPVTRYYGSKRKLIEDIWSALEERNIQFNSILDLFGGTGILSYYMLTKRKQVIYNDIFLFNCKIAKALLDTPRNTFKEIDAIDLLNVRKERDYKQIIEDNFEGVYYTNAENKIIDIVTQNIHYLPDNMQASAYYILIQSCIIKRPFNLFHRNNLNLRINHTKSKFGNKVTWEQSFYDLFIKFTKELNEFQFSEQQNIQIINTSALNCNVEADVVYIDTPYFNNDGSMVSYHSRYHFLEGLVNYDLIENNIDLNKKNKEICINKNKEFECKQTFLEELHNLISKHRNSIIVLSYTSNGYPSPDELKEVVMQFKNNVEVVSLGKHSFALNKHNEGREEILVIGR